jgi:hypothetical protein
LKREDGLGLGEFCCRGGDDAEFELVIDDGWWGSVFVVRPATIARAWAWAPAACCARAWTILLRTACKARRTGAAERPVELRALRPAPIGCVAYAGSHIRAVLRRCHTLYRKRSHYRGHLHYHPYPLLASFSLGTWSEASGNHHFSTQQRQSSPRMIYGPSLATAEAPLRKSCLLVEGFGRSLGLWRPLSS